MATVENREHQITIETKTSSATDLGPSIRIILASLDADGGAIKEGEGRRGRQQGSYSSVGRAHGC